ncbi:alpha/beta hydrolase [Geodermatophilus sp. TF02-6]|uniref:alpha/beta fold hydrolase n=1 Tax=Geodermatophilus sp. TF02-6 TaxID=2250575 RepID=UPI000DEA8974|nr:alpha/beta hydrolase [Geodermatophilus sp. TF02-6]RBY78148.1 alpha/beta hydrolase [Geodermatophilus sp. TF02-6]
MFDGFQTVDVLVRTDAGEVTVHAAVGGEGPPVLLLHGFPQTHVMWHRIAPALAETHTVVAADLRGYGDTSRPPAGDDHAGYSFRAMAADQRALMAELGHDRFAVVGHDRGARVAHRLALDAPDAVTRVALLDVLPTAHVYDSVDRRLATAYYHWFFFVQPAPVPERLIGGDPIGYLHTLLGGWGGSGVSFYDPAAVAEYERVFADADARHAMLEDYRAGASVDYEQDSADAAEGRRVEAPVLVVWGGRGVVGTGPDDPVEVWRSRARDVSGCALDAGHFLAEERPDETLAVLRDFLSRSA